MLDAILIIFLYFHLPPTALQRPFNATRQLFFFHFIFRYVDVIEQAVVAGDTVLIENLEETIDPVIDPLLGRHTIKKGR